MKFRYYILFFLIAVTTVIALSWFTRNNEITDVDPDTKRLCREYADRDHEKELAPERWAWKKADWQAFDWYTSCINHVKHPVAQ